MLIQSLTLKMRLDRCCNLTGNVRAAAAGYLLVSSCVLYELCTQALTTGDLTDFQKVAALSLPLA